jgi:hypothetical protein
MRFTVLALAALSIGVGGCVTKLVDQSCQDRGYSPGTALYDACYPSAGVAIAQTYARAVQTSLQWPYPTPPPCDCR